MHVSPATRRSLVNFGDRVGTANAYLIIALMVGAMIAELFASILRAFRWVRVEPVVAEQAPLDRHLVAECEEIRDEEAAVAVSHDRRREEHCFTADERGRLGCPSF